MTAALADADLARRFGGLDRLYGVTGANRIRAAHVAVIGLGGVGSWAAESLAEQRAIEQADTLSFEDYLAAYYRR